MKVKKELKNVKKCFAIFLLCFISAAASSSYRCDGKETEDYKLSFEKVKNDIFGNF
jgi:hypothetical protein